MGFAALGGWLPFWFQCHPSPKRGLWRCRHRHDGSGGHRDHCAVYVCLSPNRFKPAGPESHSGSPCGRGLFHRTRFYLPATGAIELIDLPKPVSRRRRLTYPDSLACRRLTRRCGRLGRRASSLVCAQTISPLRLSASRKSSLRYSRTRTGSPEA